jgi:hypothetical protein
MTPEVKQINKIIRHNTTLIRRIRKTKSINKAIILKEKLCEGFKAFKEAIETGSVNFG